MTIYGCKKFEEMIHNNGKNMTNDESKAAALHAMYCDTPECKSIITAIKKAKSYEDVKQLAGYSSPKRMFDND